MREPSKDEVRELQEQNAVGYAEYAGEHACIFDDVSDPAAIEPGFNCGGCACHVSAPCHHCMYHLPEEDSYHIAQMLHLTGRGTER